MSNYLYNGVKLPTIPWEYTQGGETVTMTHAFIEKKEDNPYNLYVSTIPNKAYTVTGGTRTSADDNYYDADNPFWFVGYTLDETTFTWEFVTGGHVSAQNAWTTSTSTLSDTDFKWANYNIYYRDSVADVGGTLYLAASDPVPVGGGMEYAIIPKSHYKAACDAIRAKTGKTDLIVSGDMATLILSITSGGDT